MELYLNNIRVDLDERIPFPLTYQVSDIKNPDKRKGSNSKTITLPDTRINRDVMESVFVLSTTEEKDLNFIASSNNFDPSIKAEARYYENGILQFKGIAQLRECILKNGFWKFNLVLLSDQVDIFTLLKNYKVRELGWSEYNHALTYANQQNSWSGTIQKNGSPYSNYSGTDWLGEGYYYGLIDYGYERPSADNFQVGDIPPQVFVKSIIDKMFDKIEVSYDSDFFGTQQFKRLLLAYEGGVFPEIDSATSTANSIETDQVNFGSGYIFEGSSNGFYDPTQQGQIFDFNFPSQQVEYNSNSGTEVDPSSLIQNSTPLKFVAQSEGDYELNYSGDHDVNFDVTLVGGTGTSNVYGKFRVDYAVIVNNVVYQTGLLWNNEVSTTSLTNSFTASFNLDVDIYLQPSDEVRVGFILTVDNPSVTNTTATSASATFDITATTCALDIAYPTQTISPGATVNIKQFLPDMDCATFFKGLITMFNLYVKPATDDDRKLKIEPLNDFYNGSNIAVNWTHLVDYSKDFKVTPTINLSSKSYNFRFQEDADYWNARYFNDVVEQYGSKTVVNPSQFATQETTYKLPFAQKLLGEIPNTNLIVPRNFQVKTDEDGVSEIVERRGKPFIVQIKAGNVGTLQSGDWYHIDETDVANVQTEYPYVGHLDDLDSPGFDLNFNIPSYVFYDLPSGVTYTTNNLYVYHERFIKEVIDKNSRLLTCYIKLTPDVINSLDFGDLINIDGVIYRLQKIENYDSGKNETTKVELLKILEGESIQTYILPNIEIDPYEPPLKRFQRITEAGELRETEDGLDIRRRE